MKNYALIAGLAGLLAAAPGLTQPEPAPAPSVSGDSATDTAALLQEIEALRKQVSDLQTVKDRLSKLESQVAAQTKAATPAANAPRPLTSAIGPIKVSGFIQSRFESNDQRNPDTDFYLRRVRLKVQADPTPYSSAVFQWDAAGAGVVPLDGYVDLKTKYGGYFVRGGQFKVPFGYEVFESSADRLAPERSRVITALFPNSVRDRGFYAARVLKGKPSFYLGAVNGNGLTRDNNNEKDYVAHAEFPVAATTSVGVSGYSGKFTTITTDKAGKTVRTDTRKDHYGLNAQSTLGKVELHGEFVGGKNLDAKVQGGYLQAAYLLGKVPGGLPFIKYDWFDPNRDKAKDSFSRWTLGYAYDVDKAARLTLAHEFTKDQATTGKDDITTFQIQVRY